MTQGPASGLSPWTPHLPSTAVGAFSRVPLPWCQCWSWQFWCNLRFPGGSSPIAAAGLRETASSSPLGSLLLSEGQSELETHTHNNNEMTQNKHRDVWGPLLCLTWSPVGRAKSSVVPLGAMSYSPSLDGNNSLILPKRGALMQANLLSPFFS